MAIASIPNPSFHRICCDGSIPAYPRLNRALARGNWNREGHTREVSEGLTAAAISFLLIRVLAPHTLTDRVLAAETCLVHTPITLLAASIFYNRLQAPGLASRAGHIRFKGPHTIIHRLCAHAHKENTNGQLGSYHLLIANPMATATVRAQ